MSLKNELERLFKKKNLSEITQDEMSANITELNAIHARARELERKNQLLRAKYAHDAKYARVHKRLMEKGDLKGSERKLFDALAAFKAQADAKILQNAQLLNNPAFAEKDLLKLVVQQFNQARGFTLDAAGLKAINSLILKEYLDEFHGKISA